MNHKTNRSPRPFSVLLLLLTLLAPCASHAIEFTSTNQFQVAQDQSIPEELWLQAETVDIAGKTANDLFCIGSTCTLSGEFAEDLWSAGRIVTYSGSTRQHVRLAATSISFSGAAGNNVMCFGTTADITEQARINGNVLMGGETCFFQGKTTGNLTMFAVHATLSGTVDGTAVILSDDIVVQSGTHIKGNLEYLSKNELILNAGVIIDGKLVRRSLPVTPQADTSWRSTLLTQAYFFMGILLAGLLWAALFPEATGFAVGMIRESSLKCLLTGLIALVVIPLIVIMLLITVVGIPLGAILGATFASMVYLSKIFPAYFIGVLVLRRTNGARFSNYFSILSTGLLIIYGAALLPTMGLFVWLFSTSLGLGAFLLALIRMRRDKNSLMRAIINNEIPTVNMDEPLEPMENPYDLPKE